MIITGRYSTSLALSEPPGRTEAFTMVDKIRIKTSLKLLTDLRLPVCRAVMRAIASEGPMTTTELIRVVSWIEDRDVAQSAISVALSVLRRHRLLKMTISGRHHTYSIDKARIIRINRALADFCRP